MTAASDVPEAVRPWLDALRSVWPDMRVVHDEGEWVAELGAPVAFLGTHGWELSWRHELTPVVYPDPASLVARLRELLPVPAKPEPTFTCERCAISWVTADGARCPGCGRAERRERASVERVAVPLRDASRRLVDELARYQRAGRGTPLPSEVVAAVEDVRAALEVSG